MLVYADQWKNLSESERAESGLVKQCVSGPTEVAPEVLADALKQIGFENAERVLPWTVSTDDRDREQDVIVQSGWDLENYRKNPIILWSHDPSQPPIGKALDVWTDKRGNTSRLRMLKQFTAQDENAFGFMIYRLASNGYVKTASVGFRPIKAEADPDAPDGSYGIKFMKNELLEDSIVNIPANPAALQGAKSMHNIDLTPLVPWCEKILDTFGTGATERKQAEEARRAVVGSKPFIVISGVKDLSELTTATSARQPSEQ